MDSNGFIQPPPAKRQKTDGISGKSTKEWLRQGDSKLRLQRENFEAQKRAVKMKRLKTKAQKLPEEPEALQEIEYVGQKYH